MTDGQGAGVIFDIDGTLADTNFLHAVAWRRAFVENGFDVPTAWVHRMVGAGSDVLMTELVGREVAEVKTAWRHHFGALKGEIRALPGAGDVLRAVARRGLTVALASSSEEEDLEPLLRAVDADDVISAVTSAGDVDDAKPSPEVFEAALAKAELDAGSAIVVGDTGWDVEAAARCGLRCIGVLTGGVSRGELLDAGAAAVFRDVSELRERLDESPIATLTR